MYFLCNFSSAFLLLQNGIFPTYMGYLVFFANSLRPFSFYKSEAKRETGILEPAIQIGDWVFLQAFFIGNQVKGVVLKIS